ncbi:MAG: hypothetical protein GX230_10205 [Lentisphaerae bacterium]|nr:hypothetical protein [Lentisphaerota bacterium]
MEQRWQWVAIAALAAATAVIGVSLPYLAGDNGLPQLAGSSVWDTILGDARLQVSASFMEKADQYYHGGVAVDDCLDNLVGTSATGGTDEGDSLDVNPHTHDHHNDHEDGDHHGHHDHCDGSCGGVCKGHHHGHGVAGSFMADPWHWINSYVHAQEHRHMKSNEAQELLPWLWAACRSAPQNIRAFQSSAYVLEKMLERPLDAAQLLEEGIEQNPASGELEFALGEVMLRSLKDERRAEQAFNAAVEKLGAAGDAITEDDQHLMGRAMFYAGRLALKRGDRVRAEEIMIQAEARAPGNVGTRGLRKLLDKAE